MLFGRILKLNIGLRIALLFAVSMSFIACTISGLIQETNTDVSYNLTKLEIEKDASLVSSTLGMQKVAALAAATKGKAAPVYVKVTVWDVKPKPKKGFHPELKVIAQSRITNECGSKIGRAHV